MLSSESKYPWPLGIMVYRGEFSTDWQLILAFITLTILPTVIVFFAAQKHIIAGLTAEMISFGLRRKSTSQAPRCRKIRRNTVKSVVAGSSGGNSHRSSDGCCAAGRATCCVD